MGLDIAFHFCLAKAFLRSSNLAREEKGTLACDAGSSALPLGLVPLGFANATQSQGTQTPSSESATSLGPRLTRAVPVPWVDSGFLVLLT